MFAVIKTGGKQYRVVKDDVLAVEKVVGEAGAQVVFDHVVMLDGEIGKPRVDGAQVVGTVVRQFKDETKIIFKKRRRKHYRRRNGHRQMLTLVKITDIGKGIATVPAASAKADAAPKKKATKKAAAAA